MDSKSTSRPFPGFDHLYWLREPGAVRYFRATLELSEDAFKVTRGEEVPAHPVRARWMMGGKAPVDVVRTDDAAPVLISDRLRSLLRESGLTGWSTYEVELFAKDGEPIQGYSGLAVHGRCGPLDNSRSVQVPKQFPAGVFPVWKGLYFDPASWDGSDLFMPAVKGGWIFLTERVKRALENAKVKNVVFAPLGEVERYDL